MNVKSAQRPMLHPAHLVTKGGDLPFAAVCVDGSNAQEASFAKSGSLQARVG